MYGELREACSYQILSHRAHAAGAIFQWFKQALPHDRVRNDPADPSFAYSMLPTDLVLRLRAERKSSHQRMGRALLREGAH